MGHDQVVMRRIYHVSTVPPHDDMPGQLEMTLTSLTRRGDTIQSIIPYVHSDCGLLRIVHWTTIYIISYSEDAQG